MGLTIDNDPSTRAVRSLHFACDHDGCAAETDDRKIADAGGLIELGWLRRFNEVARRNEYFCPAHKEEHRGN